ncbi:hypothetical protein HY504_01975 [Candidatus Wolfebacteria bacterium]|nr:hypothetical protein [Candidatus Wolfebacteria bacterium]
MAEQPHQVQRKILLLFKENGNKLPPFRSIAKHVGVSSTNTVAHHVKILKSKGFLISPGGAKAHIAPFNLRAILNFRGVPGVYMVVREDRGRNDRVFIAQSDNVGEHVLRSMLENALLEEAIQEHSESLRIALYSIEDEEARVKLLEELNKS